MTQYDPYYMYGNTPEGADAISRWSEAYNNDFAARMDWSVTPNYKDANHHPIAVLNGDSSRQVMYVTAAAGSELTLSAAGSRDPDEDELSYAWTYYDEPSSYDGAATIRGEKSAIATLRMPEDAAGETLHVILQVYDDGAPNLYAYRRLVVEVQPHETG